MALVVFLASVLNPLAGRCQQIFSNFPVNGQISAFQINGGYSVSESFTVTASSTAGQVVFGAWLRTGDSVTQIAWSLGAVPFGSSVASGVAAATSSYSSSNADGFDVNTVSFAIPGIALSAGTYYLTLSGAVSAAAGSVYWDINDGAGVDAWDSSYGHVSASNTCFGSVGISGTCASSFQILSVNTNVTSSASSLTFASQNVGTTSASQAVTITNNGPGAASITGIAIGGTNPGDFAQTNNCPLSPATLAANAFCAIGVTFTPAAAGTRVASVILTGTSALSVSLSGTGTPVPPTVTLSASSLAFGSQTVNTTSAAQMFTVTNSGPNPLTINSIAPSGTNAGDFAQTNNCPVSPAAIAVNGFCTVSVTFTPQAAGTRAGAISITDNGSGSPQAVTVGGTGTAPVPVVTLSRSSVPFPNQTANTTSGAQSVTVTNSGTGPLSISGITIGGANPGDFAQTNNCPVSPATLAAGAFCTIGITFTPQAAGMFTASVNIADNAVGSPQPVGLTGTGVAASLTWPNGYTYEATFTVAAGRVPSPQTNFAALISGTFPDFATAANGGRILNTCTQTVGNNLTSVPCDLIFTSDAAGTMLVNWEFESYAAATGAVNVWVNVPNLGSGTVVYAWYGQPSVTTIQTAPAATWNSTYGAVYHLKENPAGAAPQMNDSTANANHAAMNGAVQANQQQPGEIGGSVNFEGNTWAAPAAAAGYSFDRTDSFSLSGWFRTPSNSAGTLLSKFAGGLNAGWALLQFSGAANPVFALGLFGTGSSTSAIAETPAVTTGAWHYLVATYSGTGTAAGMNLYVDGVSQPLTVLTNNLATSIANSTIPAINGRGGANSMSSDLMDEIRVSAKGVVFSPAWVTATFNNQSQPGTFFTTVTGLTSH